MKRLLSTIMLAGLIPLLGVNAQPVKFAQAGMPFLKIDVGGRAAMAGVHNSMQGDAFSMFYNPAGLASINGADVATSMTQWIADISHYAVGAAYNVENIGTFGIGFIWMDYGDFTRTVPTDDIEGFRTDGTFTVSEYALNLSYARALTDRFYFGGSLKYASQDLGAIPILNPVNGQVETVDNNVNNVIFDFGTLFYPGWKDFRFGLSLRNFSNQSDYFNQRFELPLTFDFGAAMDIMTLFREADENNVLTVAFDWLHPRDFSERAHVGVEYALAKTIYLRGGYKFNYDEEGITGGVTLKRAFNEFGLTLDYVYSDFGIFDSVNRYSAGFFFTR